MSDEIMEVIQIIEFTGRGAGAILRLTDSLLQGTVKTAGKTKQWTSLQIMQARLKLHYADKGTNSSLALSDLEKLTGGNYGIMKIPLERGIGKSDLTDIQNFFDALKTLKIPFAELPDLNVGDGFIEIAYNPQDVSKLKDFMNIYKFPKSKQAKDISLEEYLENATPEGEKALAEHAIKEVRREEEKEQKKGFRGDFQERGTPFLWKDKKLEKKNASQENLHRLKYSFLAKLYKKLRSYVVNIPKEDVYQETEHGYIMKIPNGEEPCFWAVSKKSCIQNKDKNLTVFVEKIDSFDILDKEGRIMASVSGDKMYTKHQEKRGQQSQTKVTGLTLGQRKLTPSKKK